MALDFRGAEPATTRGPLTVSALNRAVAGLLERSFPLGAGARRGRQPHPRGERALVLRPQGRPGAGALRDVPRPQPVAELGAARRRRGRGVGRGVAVRGARRIPAGHRVDAAGRTGPAVRGVPAAQGEARGGGTLRHGRQAAPAWRPAKRRRRHVAAGGGPARRADLPRPPRPVRIGRRLSGTGPGRGRGRADRRDAGHGFGARRSRCGPARSRRRVPRGPLGVQRGSGGPRDPRVADCRSWSVSATKATSPSPTSPPTSARRRRPRRPNSSRPRGTPCSARRRAASGTCGAACRTRCSRRRSGWTMRSARWPRRVRRSPRSTRAPARCTRASSGAVLQSLAARRLALGRQREVLLRLRLTSGEGTPGDIHRPARDPVGTSSARGRDATGGARRGRLAALDPHAVLKRGYAMALAADGKVVTDAARLAVGDSLTVRFARGAADVRVQALPTGDSTDDGKGWTRTDAAGEIESTSPPVRPHPRGTPWNTRCPRCRTRWTRWHRTCRARRSSTTTASTTRRTSPT